jgi:hypothetical protein
MMPWMLCVVWVRDACGWNVELDNRPRNARVAPIKIFGCAVDGYVIKMPGYSGAWVLGCWVSTKVGCWAGYQSRVQRPGNTHTLHDNKGKHGVHP